MSSSLSLEFVWHGKLHRLKGLFKDKDENNIGYSKDEKKVEEREKDEGGDRNKDGRSKADDENKALFGGAQGQDPARLLRLQEQRRQPLLPSGRSETGGGPPTSTTAQ